MKLLIIGVGYVGLVTGSCMAEMGHVVTCLDIDSEKISELKKGKIPFYEIGLESIVKKNFSEGRLIFTDCYSEAMLNAEVCFICVDTPTSHDNHANLKYVKEVASSIGEHLNEYKIIVNKSTVPIGTATLVKEIIKNKLMERKIEVDFDIVSNPEFLAEGNAVNNCLKPDRVIIGSDSDKAKTIMKEIYAPFMLNHERFITMDIPSAEMTKYAANVMLASRVSLMNELAGLCEKVGANIDLVRIGIGSDHRIGYKFIYPGIGFGGSCLPKDIKALKALANDFQYETPILSAIQEVNERQKRHIGNKIIEYFQCRNGIENKVIGILGLSFKPDTDDMREAPSLTLIHQLLQAGFTLKLYDPIAMNQAKKVLEGIKHLSWCNNEKEVAKQADALVLVTEWRQFRFLDLKSLKEVMKGNAFFDGRNQYSYEKMAEAGFDYICIGKIPLLSNHLCAC